MNIYDVTVTRTESITFRVKAINRTDAEDRYLMEGKETDSSTTELEVDTIELVTDEAVS